MARFADAFIALPGIIADPLSLSLSGVRNQNFYRFCAVVIDPYPKMLGGYGTLEELLEVITWAQLGIHKKPVKTHSQLAMILLTRNYPY